MPREVVIQKWCDPCDTDNQPNVRAISTWTVGAVKGETQPTLRQVDTCELHDKQFDELNKLLAVCPPFIKRAHAPAPAKPREIMPPLAAPPESGDKECPVCFEAYAGRAGLIQHIWQVHRPGEERTRVSQTGRCPDCSESFTTPQGFAAHRRIKHNWSATDEALSGVKGFKLVKA